MQTTQSLVSDYYYIIISVKHIKGAEFVLSGVQNTE